MGWNPESAVNAYLDAIKLCKQMKSTCLKNTEPQSTEFIAAMAGGMNAQLMVDVSSASALPSTIALAAAARHTGGRLVCILPDPQTLAEAQKAVKDLGLEGTAEFVTGDATELLPRYKNVDFFIIDCMTEDYAGLSKHLNVNPSEAVVVAHNVLDRKATAAYTRTFKRKFGAKSTTLPIGKGIEVTRIGNNFHSSRETPLKDMARKADREGMARALNLTAAEGNKRKWIVQVDERTGEEHVFRVVTER